MVFKNAKVGDLILHCKTDQPAWLIVDIRQTLLNDNRYTLFLWNFKTHEKYDLTYEERNGMLWGLEGGPPFPNPNYWRVEIDP
jgi:hypothetical protein